MNLTQKYGTTALIAGASEGIGAAFAELMAAEGMDLILIARRQQPLQQLAVRLETEYNVNIKCIACDLSEANVTDRILEKLNGTEISLLVYNAALSRIGPFIKNSEELHSRMAATNMLTPLKMLHSFGGKMLDKGKGAFIFVTSMAGLQGSGYLAVYAATKAFIRILGESLWYEWKDSGVDVIACIAGATSTPGYIASRPVKAGLFAPRTLTPEEVTKETLGNLGRMPSFIAGRANRIASFFMHRILPGKTAINVMGNTTRKMYGL